MCNMKEILEVVATDKSIKYDFVNIESTSELFEICKKKGYIKTKVEFESEFEEFLKENKLLELNSDELLKISGGTNWNIKRIPTLIILSLIIGRNISTYGLMPVNNNNKISTKNLSNTTGLFENMSKQFKLSINQLMSYIKKISPLQYLSQTNDVSTLRNKDFILDLPKDLKWKMVIDAKFHNTSQGSMIFDEGGENHLGETVDKEPGYLQAMLKAWNFMIDSIRANQPLNVYLYESFHRISLTDVSTGYDDNQFLNYWRNGGYSTRFSLCNYNNLKNYTIDGFKEFFYKCKSGWDFEKELNSCKITLDNKNYYPITSKIEEFITHVTRHKDDWLGYFFGCNFETSDDSKEFADKVFKGYYKKLEELKSKNKVDDSLISDESSLEDKKLEIIIRVCQALDQAHVFWDGNIRTVVFITMNKMLIENGLNPTCMYDPNTLDCTDVRTLIQQVKDGQAYFLSLVS